MNSRKERKVTGQTPSSRANARDLRKISPFGRNDKNRPLIAVLPRSAFSRYKQVSARYLVEPSLRNEKLFAYFVFFAVNSSDPITEILSPQLRRDPAALADRR
jgi:hypothetical protein